MGVSERYPALMKIVEQKLFSQRSKQLCNGIFTQRSKKTKMQRLTLKQRIMQRHFYAKKQKDKDEKAFN